MDSLNRRQPCDLAIIGMGCLFPKAGGLEAYWSNIKHGVDAITEIPPSHWRPEDYFDDDPKRADFTYGRRGGFLEPFAFDPLKYGIPPNALEATDTSQLLAMAVAQAAMEDAGYGGDRPFDRNRTSVILGITGAMELVIPLGARLGHPVWRKAMLDAGIPPEQVEDAVERISDSYVPWQENSFPGLLGNVVAGRVSKHLDLSGTNCVVDAACASSLSALHLASMELMTGKSDLVVTGGVDTFNDIFMYMCFSKTPALSPTGHARPFDHEGDGTTLGEGLGLLVLKRLADAERDGDTIYSVLKGIGSSSDGKGEAIYAPAASGQVKALRAAYECADLSPETVELLEGHGTGTKRGDEVELEALREVYGETDRAGAWCALGSVKSQIGHTKAAAGAAGLIKASLALHAKVLPPTIKVEQPSDVVAPGATPFYVNTKMRPWVGNAANPRRAAVSSFGFGGSNFHCILEESDGTKRCADWDGATQILAFSGDGLAEIRTQLSKTPADGDWTAMRAFAKASRESFDSRKSCRLTVVLDRETCSATIDELRRAVEGASVGEMPKGAFFGEGAAKGTVAAIFPGQGTQYVGMLRELACTFPEFLDVLRDTNVAFGSEHETRRIEDLIYPHSAFDDETRAEQKTALTATNVAQPAIGALSLAAWKVLGAFGVQAACTAGHSYGELTALCAAGRLSPETFLRLSVARGRAMAAGDGDRGTMYAVRATADEVAAIMDEEKLDVVLANKNGPRQVVLSGATDAIAKAAAALKSRKISGTNLPVAAAFHSTLVASATEDFGKEVKKAGMDDSTVPVYANTTGEMYPSGAPEAEELLSNQLAKPVEFVKQIEAMYRDGARTFIEVGPGNRMAALVRDILSGSDDATALSIDSSGGKGSGIQDLGSVIAQLATLGHAVDLTQWDDSFIAPVQTNGKARMTIEITGANYRTPRKEAPKSVKVAPPIHAAKTNAGTSGDIERRSVAAVSQAAAPSISRPTREPAPAIPAAAVPTSAAPTPELTTLLRQSQEQISALHKQFLEGQEVAAKSVTDLLARQSQLAGTYRELPVGDGHVPQPSTMEVEPVRSANAAAPVRDLAEPTTPVQATPEPATQGAQTTGAKDQKLSEILFAVVAEKTGYPAEMLEADMSLDGDLGIDSIKRVEILSALQEAIPSLPAIDADRLGEIQTLQDILESLDTGAAGETASALNAPGRPSAAEALLEVVSEKTGYPVESLELEMSLDGDLGIDSIKRVEILSAVQERIPGLSSVDAEVLGQFQTLRDVVDYLDEASDGAPPQGSPEPSTATADDEALIELLLSVVSDKTGYPADMLELEMSLDADLGIDSIKRVEILSAMQDAMPALPQVDAESLGKIQTLREVIEYLSAEPVADTAKSAETAAPISEPVADGGPLERWVVRSVDLGPAKTTPETQLKGELPIWVVGDGSEFPERVVEALLRLELKAQSVPIDSVAATDVPDALEGVVIVGPEGTVDSSFLVDSLSIARQTAEALARGAECGPTIFATVSRMDGAFGLLGPVSPGTAIGGGLAGLAKTAAQEWPTVRGRALDVSDDFPDAESGAAAVAQELLIEGSIEVGLARGQRRGLQLAAESLPETSGELSMPADHVVIVSGGARGVTAACAKTIATKGGAVCVLFGRTAWPVSEPEWLRDLSEESEIKRALHEHAEGPMGPRDLEAAYSAIAGQREISRTMEDIAAAGGRVEYRSVDICDPDAVNRAVKETRESVGPIAGIVHGAGVLADKMIVDLDRADIERVLNTKVIGFQNLLAATADDELRVIAAFSSSTGRFGRKGQSAYAMANEALNKMAHAEAARREGCRVAALNWGPWDGGMVTPALKQLFAKEGVEVIGLRAGAEHFARELAMNSSAGVEVVLLGAGSKNPSSDDEASSRNGLQTTLGLQVSVSKAPYLRSHVIDGKAVVPAAMYIEWLAHGALHGHPGLRFVGLRDFRIYKGVLLEGDESREIRIKMGKATEEGQNTYRVPVEIWSVIDGHEVRHGGASVMLSTQHTKGETKLASNGSRVPMMYRDSIYGADVLFHGEALRGICELETCSENDIAVLARTAPRPSEWMSSPLRRSWLADPLVLDSAFQAMILWSQEQLGARSLPVGIGAYTQCVAAFPKGRVRVHGRITSRGKNRVTADIEIANPATGALIARLDNYECVVDASLAAAFKRNTLAASETSTSGTPNNEQ